LIVDAAYVLAVLAAAVLVVARDSLQVRYGIGELAPRLVTGLVAAHLAMPLCRGLIELANGLTGALTGDSITAPGGIAHLQPIMTGAMREPGQTGPQQFLIVVIGVMLVLTLGLLFGWLVRIGLLVVLTGIAPLALACHGLPQTELVAKLWCRSLLAALFVVTAQVFALHTTLTVFLDPHANLRAAGLPADPRGAIDLLIVACLVWATVRIPAMARRYVTRSRPPTVAALVQGLIVQQLTRGLGRGACAGRVLARSHP
jgi:hypothetical protein